MKFIMDLSKSQKYFFLAALCASALLSENNVEGTATLENHEVSAWTYKLVHENFFHAI